MFPLESDAMYFSSTKVSAEGHYFLDSYAMRTARPVKTPPISQRCPNSHSGRPDRKADIDPAITAIIAFTARLIEI